MKTEELTLFTYSPEGVAPSFAPPASTKPYLAICFIPYGMDEKTENGWTLKQASILLSGSEDDVAKAFIKVMSCGHVTSDYSVWFDFGSVVDTDPWVLAKRVGDNGKCIATKRSNKKIYETFEKKPGDVLHERISARFQKTLLDSKIPNENAIDSSIIVRKKGRDLFHIEKRWMVLAVHCKYLFIDAALPAAIKDSGTKDKFMSINE